MSTITAAQQQAIRDYFASVTEIPAGLGTKEAACSMAGINLALTGRLTDKVPECMSPVVGRWIVGVQDAMPTLVRNSPEWRELLPLAAGTGREEERERERLEIIMEWMWGTVLPSLQPIADMGGYGEAWGAMCRSRDEDAAWDAADAARAARAAAGAAARAAEDEDAAWAAFRPVMLLRKLCGRQRRQKGIAMTYGIHTDLATGDQYAAEYRGGLMIRAWPLDPANGLPPQWDCDIKDYLDKVAPDAETAYRAIRLDPAVPEKQARMEMH